MSTFNSLEELMAAVPDLLPIVKVLTSAGIGLSQPIVYQTGSFSMAELKSVDCGNGKIFVGSKATVSCSAIVLIRIDLSNDNKILCDKSQGGWKIVSHCNSEAPPWFVLAVHTFLDIEMGGCEKSQGSDHRGHNEHTVTDLAGLLAKMLRGVAAMEK